MRAEESKKSEEIGKVAPCALSPERSSGNVSVYCAFLIGDLIIISAQLSLNLS